jgi:4-hydroxyphenylpyruvate dioxygenase
MTDKLAVGRMAFIQFAAPDPGALETVFSRIGMTAVARHRRKAATLYRQGDVNFVLDSDPASHAAGFAREHGPGITALAIPVDDPAQVRKAALGLGARPYVGAGAPLLDGELVEGVGGSILHLVPRDRPDRWFADFEPLPGVDQHPQGFGATHVDHVTHCVPVPEMRYWVDFYRRIFGFSIVFEFEARGKASGFHTQAVRDDGMNVCVTILEPTTPESQIQEFMDEYRGAGVQHVALASRNLYRTVDLMRRAGTEFLPTPGAYYDAIDQRLPGHREDVAELRRLDILLDGTTRAGSDDGEDHLLLQIFTRKMVGPIFFEAIQRKANYGFGEGNAQALFDAIEREQLARG